MTSAAPTTPFQRHEEIVCPQCDKLIKAARAGQNTLLCPGCSFCVTSPDRDGNPARLAAKIAAARRKKVSTYNIRSVSQAVGQSVSHHRC
jgi:hypothetical protein